MGIENVIVHLYTRTGDEQRSRPVPPHQCPEELLYALARRTCRPGCRPPEVSPWTDRLDPGRWYRPAQARAAADDVLPAGDSGGQGWRSIHQLHEVVGMRGGKGG